MGFLDNAEQPVSLKIALLKMIALHHEMRRRRNCCLVSPIPTTSKRIHFDFRRAGGGLGGPENAHRTMMTQG